MQMKMKRKRKDEKEKSKGKEKTKRVDQNNQSDISIRADEATNSLLIFAPFAGIQ